MAPLSICEVLLFVLNDADLLPESEVMGVLKDAASTHGHATGSATDPEKHKAVAAPINRIIIGGNSVRRKSHHPPVAVCLDDALSARHRPCGHITSQAL